MMSRECAALKSPSSFASIAASFPNAGVTCIAARELDFSLPRTGEGRTLRSTHAVAT